MRASGFIVQFTNVGRNHVSWEERLPRPVDENQIVAAVRRKRVLMSSDIDAAFNGDSDYSGRIYAGICAVGHFLVVLGSEA